jgi:plasmid maintenance system antidote protein VapI
VAASRTKAEPDTLADQLRAALVASDLSHYRISKDTGISQPVVTRFINGDRDLRLETAGKLAAYLGMRLTEAKPIRRDL